MRSLTSPWWLQAPELWRSRIRMSSWMRRSCPMRRASASTSGGLAPSKAKISDARSASASWT